MTPGLKVCQASQLFSGLGEMIGFASDLIRAGGEADFFFFAVFFEIPLVIVSLLTFSFIPFLEAEIKMMFGKKYKSLHFTPKHRTEVKGVK